MAEAENVGLSRFWRWFRMFLLSLGLVFLVGMVAGFLIGAMERADGLTTRRILILAGLALAALGCGWLLLREVRAPTGEEPLTPKERLNRNIMIGCGLLGAVIGMTVSIAGGRDALRQGVFSDNPLPAGVALAIVLVMGLIVPAISIYWHRKVVDEQEADAYKSGALFGVSAYMIGAPVWWFAWRGGFAPEPNGIVIYLLTTFIVGAVWMWKKYR